MKYTIHKSFVYVVDVCIVYFGRVATVSVLKTRQYRTHTHVALCCSVLQCVAVFSCSVSVLKTRQYRTHCNTLQRTATGVETVWVLNTRHTRQHTATHDNTLQHTATHCNTLQHMWQQFRRSRLGNTACCGYNTQ